MNIIQIHSKFPYSFIHLFHYFYNYGSDYQKLLSLAQGAYC